MKFLLERLNEVPRAPLPFFFYSGTLGFYASVDMERNYGRWKREILNRPEIKKKKGGGWVAMGCIK